MIAAIGFGLLVLVAVLWWGAYVLTAWQVDDSTHSLPPGVTYYQGYSYTPAPPVERPVLRPKPLLYDWASED